MSQFNTFPAGKWSIPGDADTEQVESSLVFQLQPYAIVGQEAQYAHTTVTQLQIQVIWTGMTGGAGDSTLDVNVYYWSTYFGIGTKYNCTLAKVNDTVATTYTTYTLASAAAPSDGDVYLRAGNFNNSDGRLLKLYAERFSIEIANGGTAYTGGSISAIAHGWSV